MITNGFTYVAVLLFMAAVLVTLEKSAKGGLQNSLNSSLQLFFVTLFLCFFAHLKFGIWQQQNQHIQHSKIT